MANVIISDAHLTDIADAIRSKNGTENAYKPREMAAAITAIEVGSGGGSGSGDCNGMHVPEEALVIEKDCRYRFAYGAWNWFIEEFGSKITTATIGDSQFMFAYSTNLTEIPFDLNFAGDIAYQAASMFNGCKYLTSIGKIVNLYPSAMNSMFFGCEHLRHLPEFVNLNFDWMRTNSSFNASNLFQGCNSLRSIPEDFLKQIYMPLCTGYYYSHLSAAFNGCYTLDELKGINPQTGTITSNMFTSTFSGCSRAKDIIFAVQEDGTPYKVNWKTQTLNLYDVGTSPNGAPVILNKNSGITADKEVTDDASYQALKDNPDWFTIRTEYSRYNHDSAVNTINSLPDTSEYLASAGGTNTIRFKGASGSKTDGGAINTLTEEEIAVAVAKGWTVTFA